MRLRHLLVSLSLFAASAGLGAVASAPKIATPSAESSLRLLKQGNFRYANGVPLRPDRTAEHRQQVAAGQHPFAVIVTCADSQVPPELLFDQGLGDLFVLRNAGIVVDDHLLGGIEYAVEQLGVRFVIVLGHRHCDTVSAALAGSHAPGHLGSIVTAIAADLEAATASDAPRITDPDQANEIHLRRAAEAIAHDSPLLGRRVADGRLTVTTALCATASGQIQFLP